MGSASIDRCRCHPNHGQDDGGRRIATIATLVVDVIADTRKLNAGLTQAQTGISKFGALAGFAAVGVGAAMIKMGADAVGAASDLNESMNKVNVVFEDSAKRVVRWSETTAESMGISQQAALESAGTFGNLFDAIGVVDSAGAEMSMTLVQLASDLASFNNADPTQVLEALRSGLTGQVRPLRQFGIELTEATLQQFAMTKGIEKSVQEMTQAEKVQLRYQLILAQTGNAQGDFARTSDELANQQRILRAEWEDLQAELGKALLPIVLSFVRALNDLLTVLVFVASGFDDFNAKVKEAGINVAEAEIRVASWATGLLKHIPFIGGFVDVIDQMQAANEANNAALEGTPTVMDAVQAAAQGMFDRYIEGEHALSEVEEATQALTDAQRENRLATLALTNSLFGILDSAEQVEAAQRKLNQMQQAGKTDTKAYEQAVQDAILAQAGLEEAVLSYAQELADSGQTQKEVIGKVRDLGREFGLTKADLDPLIDRIRDYIKDLNNVPEDVHTTVTTQFVQQGRHTWQVGGPLQHGGIVTRPTVALIGEAGPEAVIPLDKLGTTAAMQSGDIVLQIDGRTFARITRDQLVKLGNRNAGTGL